MDAQMLIRALASLVVVCLLAVFVLGKLLPKLLLAKPTEYKPTESQPNQGLWRSILGNTKIEKQGPSVSLAVIGRLVLSREHELVAVRVGEHKTLLLALSAGGVTNLQEIELNKIAAPQASTRVPAAGEAEVDARDPKSERL